MIQTGFQPEQTPDDGRPPRKKFLRLRINIFHLKTRTEKCEIAATFCTPPPHFLHFGFVGEFSEMNINSLGGGSFALSLSFVIFKSYYSTSGVQHK